MPEQCRVPAIGAALILAAYMASPPDPACVFRGSSPETPGIADVRMVR
jgi:hypothetical protein